MIKLLLLLWTKGRLYGTLIHLKERKLCRKALVSCFRFLHPEYVCCCYEGATFNVVSKNKKIWNPRAREVEVTFCHKTFHSCIQFEGSHSNIKAFKKCRDWFRPLLRKCTFMKRKKYSGYFLRQRWSFVSHRCCLLEGSDRNAVFNWNPWFFRKPLFSCCPLESSDRNGVFAKKPQFPIENRSFCWKLHFSVWFLKTAVFILVAWGLGLPSSKVFQTKDQKETTRLGVSAVNLNALAVVSSTKSYFWMFGYLNFCSWVQPKPRDFYFVHLAPKYENLELPGWLTPIV